MGKEEEKQSATKDTSVYEDSNSVFPVFSCLHEVLWLSSTGVHPAVLLLLLRRARLQL